MNFHKIIGKSSTEIYVTNDKISQEKFIKNGKIGIDSNYSEKFCTKKGLL